MNRKIKFRVYNNKSKQWIHGPNKRNDLDGINMLGETILLGGFLDGVSIKDLNEIDVLQFTGLQDKNGRDIYEGDILVAPDDNPPEYSNAIIVVEYHGSCWCYREIGKTKIESIQSYIGLSNKDEDAEIIGNIYDNPELLK